VYFWKSWQDTYFSSKTAFFSSALYVAVATAVTGVVGLLLLKLIKHLVAGNDPNFEIEQLFGNAKLMATALAAAGILIIASTRLPNRSERPLSVTNSAWIGAVQGLCLPFRGFSRSGATISVGLALGLMRRQAEEFSFALAVVLTPAVILKEAYRLYKAHALAAIGQTQGLMHAITPSLFGMALSFLAGLAALRWLSNWLERGRWHYFGVYCLFASLVVLWVG
jgi:undecaprenyl-diphosphatase